MANQLKSNKIIALESFFKTYQYKAILSFEKLPANVIPSVTTQSISTSAGLFKKYCALHKIPFTKFKGHTKILGAHEFAKLVPICQTHDFNVLPTVGDVLTDTVVLKKGLTPIKIGSKFGLFQKLLGATPKKGFIDIPEDYTLPRGTVLCKQWTEICTLLKIKCKVISSEVLAIYKNALTLDLNYLPCLNLKLEMLGSRFKLLHSKICTKSNIFSKYSSWIPKIINKYNKIRVYE